MSYTLHLENHTNRARPPITGDRSTVSDVTMGSGPLLLGPEGIIVGADGLPVVVDAGRQGLIQVDPATGDRTFLSKESTLIIAPPSGKYATLDDTELAIITEGSITGVLDVRAALNGEDISTALDTCGTASQLLSGEFVLRCPDVG